MRIQLTEAESKIIELLWEDQPLTMTQITHRLYGVTGWTKHTVINILKRMLQKGTIRMEDVKPAKLYYPLVEKASVMEQETWTFLDKVYSGNLLLLMSAMVDSGRLSVLQTGPCAVISVPVKSAAPHHSSA